MTAMNRLEDRAYTSLYAPSINYNLGLDTLLKSLQWSSVNLGTLFKLSSMFKMNRTSKLSQHVHMHLVITIKAPVSYLDNYGYLHLIMGL